MKVGDPIGATKAATLKRCLQFAPAMLCVFFLFSVQARNMNFQTSAGTSSEARCVSNLKEIHEMIEDYVHHSGGTFPSSIDGIHLMTHDKSVFVCRAEAPVKGARKKGAFKTSYEIVNNPLKSELKNTPRARIAIVAEKTANHDGKRMVLFYDGSIKGLDEAQFSELKNNSFVLNR
jgi:prepilin-type processing-associated H-X9-DG protein